MRKKPVLSLCSCVVILSVMATNVYALPSAFHVPEYRSNLIDSTGTQPYPNMAQADEKPDDKAKPKSGTLVLPPGYQTEKAENKEKKCMTVCSRWGETCVFDVNRGRKCRRTCKEFTEECF